MRRTVALYAISALLPLIALGGVFGAVTLHNGRVALEAGARQHARFSATLIADRLADEERQITMVAQSPAFDGQLEEQRFRLLAQRVLAEDPDWRTLSVASPAGARLVDVPAPIGGRLHGDVVEMGSLIAAVRQRRTVVGDAIRGPRGTLAFAIRAPVIRAGQVRYVVSAVVPVARLQALLQFQPLPPGWRAALIDRGGQLIASTQPSPGVLGRRASEEALAARREGRTTPYWFRRVDGAAAIGLFAPVPASSWTVHVSIPAEAYSKPRLEAIAVVTLSILLCAALFLALSRLLAAEYRQHQAREAAAVQAQRMEALGRLTGGVAHDFNNLLTPILGGLELLRPRLGDDARSLRYVELAHASAERAKALVARLLAFSRRQTLSAQDVDLTGLITGLQELLARSLPPDVRLRLAPSPHPLSVLADAGQLELAILNLVLNARDAMLTGGEVTVRWRDAVAAEAADLGPGRFVVVSVEDTGAGMDEETLRHAVEPFFTTKAADKGTGLGLSMVHGFAGQSGGAFQLTSRLGAGTQASMVLPAGQSLATAPKSAVRERAVSPKSILLVDDDATVREATAEMLMQAGHHVEARASVDEAEAAIDADLPIDLVITDYLMPGRSGAELISLVRRRRPTLPVLLVTGYMGRAQDIPADVVKLRKPFSSEELQASLASLF